MEKSQENNLFLPSGCLTSEVIRLFNDGKLTGENLKKIHRHLEECPLCKEAVEGFKLMPDFKEQEEAVQDIRKGLFRLLKKKREFSTGEMKIRRVYKYVAAAASVIIIAGMFSIYHFLLKQDNNMIADNIEAEKAIHETISEKQLQPVTPVQQPKGKGSEVETKKSEIVTIEKQEEIEEPEVLAEEVKSDIKEKTNRQVSAIQISGTDSDDIEKDAVLTDVGQVYEISGVEVPEETKQKKSAVAGVAAQPEPAVFRKQELPEVSGGKEEVKTQPQFIVEGHKDFDDYIMQNIQYPESAIKEGTEGVVLVEFTINKRGKVTDVKVVESIDEHLDNEAIRVVFSSPRWRAAELNGKKIAKKMTVSIEFHLKENG